jgi:mannobiose 2-epimerase
MGRTGARSGPKPLADACHSEEPARPCDEESAVKERDCGFLARRLETALGMTGNADCGFLARRPETALGMAVVSLLSVTIEERLARLGEAMQQDLHRNVLPFWRERVLDERAGFHGLVSDRGVVDPRAPMGGVLCARLLWTFSAAHRATGDAAHLAAAEHFHRWLSGPFWDREHGGVYWMLDHEGRPLAERKQTYALAFALYGLAEFHAASGREDAAALARRLFDLVEARAADPVHGGYFEARARDWTTLADVRLSEKDQNAPRSMNTHLHVMEAYANLVRTAAVPAAREALPALVRLHLERIVDPASGHLRLFFDERFAPVSRAISYGHDIEASWLLVEAAEAAGDPSLLRDAKAAAVVMARATFAEGFDHEHGGVFAERDEEGRLDDEKHWWMQAEAVVGFLNAFALTGDGAFLRAAERTWAFVSRFLVDREHGEWRWRVRRDGSRIDGLPKVEPWKCPYHNSRAALEVGARVGRRVAG